MFKAYYKFLITVRDDNGYMIDGVRATSLVPFLIEHIGRDKVFNILSRQKVSSVWRTTKQGGRLEKFIVYNVYGPETTPLELEFKPPYKDWPLVSVAVCQRSKRAIVVLQFDCENHVFVSTLRRPQADKLISDLLKGKLTNELTQLLGPGHDFLSQLRIYTAPEE